MKPAFWWALIVGSLNGLLVWARVKPAEEKKKERKKDDPSELN